MCGRYAMALRPSQVRHMLEEDNLPVAEAPGDNSNNAPRQSYNFAPGYTGLVYRADTAELGAGPRHANRSPGATSKEAGWVEVSAAMNTRYKLQSMRWGLIPSWTKRTPNYASMIRAINCRSDSLNTPGGMWQSIKGRKRCIVLAQGYFEWRGTGPKNKQPHYVRRKDGRLMCLAGLWDCARYEGSGSQVYSYTIITTDSSRGLRFLHDRMPVVFDPGSDELRQWIDPSRHEWSKELQCLLKPYDRELEVYPVVNDVGRIGNNSPSFIIPLDSAENRSNITHFFTSVSKERAIQDAAPRLRFSSDAMDQGEVKGHSSSSTDTEIQILPSGRDRTKRRRSLDASGDAHVDNFCSSKRTRVGRTTGSRIPTCPQ